jgi:zinc protease
MQNLVQLSCLLFTITNATSQTFTTIRNKDNQGYSYEIVKNDKTNVRVYTLKMV